MHTFAESRQAVRQPTVENPLLPVRAKSGFVGRRNPVAAEYDRPGHAFSRLSIYPAHQAGTAAQTIGAQETLADGTVNTYLGQLTVRKPHRLQQEWQSEHFSSPPGSVGGAGCPGLWTEIAYRVFDNVGGTIVGATVNERFPGPTTNDQPNNWGSSAITSGASWPNTNGTFVDNLFKCCGTPPPSSPAPTPTGVTRSYTCRTSSTWAARRPGTGAGCRLTRSSITEGTPTTKTSGHRRRNTTPFKHSQRKHGGATLK
ncbi:MAG: hypothetical protein ACJ754_00785 [Pyrinomonadaceae bacterium]